MNIVKVVMKPQRGRVCNMRMYFWPVGETVMENVVNRRGRPYHEFRKHVLSILRQRGFDEHAILTAKVRWSQKAGCSCGCSPGFIISGNEQLFGRDLHVDVTL